MQELDPIKRTVNNNKPSMNGKQSPEEMTRFTMTDSSKKDGHPMAAWRVELCISHVQYLITDQEIIPGKPQDQSAHQAELAGVLGHIQHESWRLSILLGCNSLLVIKVLTNKREPEVV